MSTRARIWLALTLMICLIDGHAPRGLPRSPSVVAPAGPYFRDHPALIVAVYAIIAFACRYAMTTLHLTLSAAVPLLTAVGAMLWAGFVAKGMGDVREVSPRRDLRTW